MNWSKEWGTTPINSSPQQSNPTPSAFPDWDSRSRDEVLAEWESRKKLLEVSKEREMVFRKYVVSRAFPNADEGTNTLPLSNGYELKASIKYNYVLDPDNKKIEACLDKLAATDNEGSFIADRIVSWKANLSLKEYRELAPKYKHIIDEIITINDAAPTLEIKAPKGAK